MRKKQKKELRRHQTTRQLMGIDRLTEHGVMTAGGELVYFLVSPSNLSVLSPEGVRDRVRCLTNLLRGVKLVEILTLNSRESFQPNRDYYRQRMGQETVPAVRELLRQDTSISPSSNPPRPLSVSSPWSSRWTAGLRIPPAR